MYRTKNRRHTTHATRNIQVCAGASWLTHKRIDVLRLSAHASTFQGRSSTADGVGCLMLNTLSSICCTCLWHYCENIFMVCRKKASQQGAQPCVAYSMFGAAKRVLRSGDRQHTTSAKAAEVAETCMNSPHKSIILPVNQHHLLNGENFEALTT